jgi:hypothetical protein
MAFPNIITAVVNNIFKHFILYNRGKESGIFYERVHGKKERVQFGPKRMRVGERS